ncbi:hypothetical protein [Virgisporangium aurantiacum]|uniref:Nucleotidyltransferase domain-containing protein n=1 Tax=Virgisporangium aurantiacum TaxID=175570 RepID=A0A8J3ZIM9_9ACTN|nr:hypothetical protein [Virgisporangium aurantiacum]GIJ62226.1 hypothetical protein Vau01_097420 [Virgisporangium aurantiacum]
MAQTAERGDRRLAALPQHLQTEIGRVVGWLAPTASCVVSGSLIEGIGNASSDLDLYVISEDGSPGRSTTIGLRGSHYVDCEYLKLVELEQLGERVERQDWHDVVDHSLKDIDRYYRLAIGVPVRVTPAVARALAGLSPACAATALARHATYRAFEQLARSALAAATGAGQEAELLLREAIQWRSTATLAEDGEAYPSLKWAGEKAARRHGRDSARFRELVDGFLRPTGALDGRIHQLRAALAVHPDLAEALDSRSCRLAAGVRLVETGDTAHLIKGRDSIVPVAGPTTALCRQLAEGRSWREATDPVGRSLRLPPVEVRTAMWAETRQLRAQGFLS